MGIAVAMIWERVENKDVQVIEVDQRFGQEGSSFLSFGAHGSAAVSHEFAYQFRSRLTQRGDFTFSGVTYKEGRAIYTYTRI